MTSQAQVPLFSRRIDILLGCHLCNRNIKNVNVIGLYDKIGLKPEISFIPDNC